MSVVWLGRRTCLLLLLLLTLGACENGMQEMYRQPKLTPLAPTPLWPDGRAARPLEADTIVHSAGTLAASSSGRSGLVSEEDDSRATYTHAALERGRQRFDIYCAPCHGLGGDGNGYITARGFPHPPSYHTDRLRAAPDSYFFTVISRGYGLMYPYADRITPADRRAIIAYIRALQLSRHASLAALPPSDRARLGATP